MKAAGENCFSPGPPPASAMVAASSRPLGALAMVSFQEIEPPAFINFLRQAPSLNIGGCLSKGAVLAAVHFNLCADLVILDYVV